MNDVFVYWDNSNIFLEMQRLTEERDEGPDARYRVRVHFDNLLRLEPSKPGHQLAMGRRQAALDLSRRPMA